MDTDELRAWLRLARTPGLGRSTARRLLALAGSATGVFHMSATALARVCGADVARLLSHPDADTDALLHATAEWLAAAESKIARHVVALGDAAYPDALLHTADPPLLLHALGRVELLQAPSVGVVGTRTPTAQGLDNARAFAAYLSEAGWTVVSGLALGIDAAAHEGALAGRGSTIAVVGTGLDSVYPRRHAALAGRIAESGLVVSEYPLGTPALALHFPQRNRLIAGLSRGTLVVEAALASGSLITARQAAEAGREVFAIPGSIHSPLSRGAHALIRQGAKLVECGADLLEELGTLGLMSHTPPPAAPSSAAATDPLLVALGHDPMSLDTLVERTGWPAGELSARLLEFELDGRVARLPGGLFQRRGTA